MDPLSSSSRNEDNELETCNMVHLILVASTRQLKPYLCFACILDDTLDLVDKRQLVDGDKAYIGLLLTGVEEDDHLDIILVWRWVWCGMGHVHTSGLQKNKFFVDVEDGLKNNTINNFLISLI